MVKRMLALMLLVSLQVRSVAVEITTQDPVVAADDAQEQSDNESVLRKKEKQFCKICACCAVISCLNVSGDGSIGGNLHVGGNGVIDGTLTVAGIPINDLIGVDGAAGLPGAQGDAGVAGIPGAIGLTGPTGATGATGATGLGLTTFGNFYALMPGDNPATVTSGAAVQFPQDGPFSGLVRANASEFILPAIGTYEIGWQVSVSEPGQLDLWLDSGAGAQELAPTVVGRATGTSQIVGNTLITTSVVNSVLSVRNPSAVAPTTLTITPIAGGTHSVSATLTIKRIS